MHRGMWSKMISKFRFVILILVEPFIYYPKQLAGRIGLLNLSKIYYGCKQRESVVRDSVVRVCVHEWGGYPMVRTKKFGDKTVICGLESQIKRYVEYRKKGIVDLTITMSDCKKHKDIDFVKANCEQFIEVSNVGMDFGGYSEFYKAIRNKENCYVILSNSSVEQSQFDFLDGYINYMENNPDVGMLGISYSTRMYHTFIRRNFIPHIQSFFLLTTRSVLDEIVDYNHGFPGCDADYKRLIIREGEIPISRTTLQLGYKLAVVNPDTGVPFKFTDKKHWPEKTGDLRYSCLHPNKLSKIKL